MSEELLDLWKQLDASDPYVGMAKSRESIVRAPFAYPGSKYKSLQHILPVCPEGDNLIDVEVFGGSGVWTLNRRPKMLRVYNDRFGGVTTFYRCLHDRKKYQALCERLKFEVQSREEFLFCKETWEHLSDDVERAARWYYVVQRSFACMGRNFARTTNSPTAARKDIDPQIFAKIHTCLQGVSIENADFRVIMLDHDQPHTVFYLDPPYYNADQGGYRCKMDEQDHLEMLDLIFKVRGFVALSGFQNNLYEKYPWDNKITWDVQTSVLPMAHTASNGKDWQKDTLIRQAAKEVLWIKEAK